MAGKYSANLASDDDSGPVLLAQPTALTNLKTVSRAFEDIDANAPAIPNFVVPSMATPTRAAASKAGSSSDDGLAAWTLPQVVVIARPPAADASACAAGLAAFAALLSEAKLPLLDRTHMALAEQLASVRLCSMFDTGADLPELPSSLDDDEEEDEEDEMGGACRRRAVRFCAGASERLSYERPESYSSADGSSADGSADWGWLGDSGSLDDSADGAGFAQASSAAQAALPARAVHAARSGGGLTPEQLAARQEWAALDEHLSAQPARDPSAVGVRAKQTHAGTVIAFAEALAALLKSDLSAEYARARTSEVARSERSGASAAGGGRLRRLFGPPVLDSDLEAERDGLLALAKLAMRDELLHVRILNSVYMRLTGNRLAPMRLGSHWDVIGFQGSDPATDLRGVGMLGLVVLLFLAERYPLLGARLMRLAQDAVQRFPLVLVSLELTRTMLEAVREARLNRAANACGSVWTAALDLYCAAMHAFFVMWRRHKYTVRAYGDVIGPFCEDIKTHAKQRVATFHAAMAADAALPEAERETQLTGFS